MFIPDLYFFPSWITDPEAKKHRIPDPDPQHRTPQGNNTLQHLAIQTTFGGEAGMV